MKYAEQEAQNHFAQEFLLQLGLENDVLAEAIVTPLDLEVLEFTLNGETQFAYGAPFEAAIRIKNRVREQYEGHHLAFGLDSVRLSQLHRYPDMFARYHDA